MLIQPSAAQTFLSPIYVDLHLPLQPEGGHQEVQEVLGEELGANEILVWSRLPGQSCKVLLNQSVKTKSIPI